MSWGLGWKRPSDIFHLSLHYSSHQLNNPNNPIDSKQDEDQLGFRIDLDWNAADDEDQVTLRLQSQLMVALPLPQDTVRVKLVEDEGMVGVEMKVVKEREKLRGVAMSKAGGSGQQNDGMGVFVKMLKSGLETGEGEGVRVVESLGDHWMSVTVISLNNCGLSMLPVELTKLPLLEKLFLDNNKLTVLPPELGVLKT